MGMSVGPSSGGEEQVNSTINTTPLVDVMLVLLIIFLITVPVVTKTIELKLPVISNEATQTKPENIIIAVDKDGKIYWNDLMVSPETLLERMKAAAVQVPQPEVHIRGDQQARYEFIGRVVATAQRGGIMKVGFITDPELRGGN
ncbi:MAG: biopolymer transporter ExbD [Proteobacteria bacterium]|nr:biopolymer transporter ExbD [Pseudomonadota bacterium]